MANINSPFGLRPVSNVSQGRYVGRTEWFVVPVSDSTALFLNDPVSVAAGGDADSGLGYVAQMAAAGVPIGIVVGFGGPDSPVPHVGDDVYRLAETKRWVAVATDPDIEFYIQEDSDGGNVAIDEAHTNAPIVVGTGSTSTGQSAVALNSSEVATTATDELAILGLAQIPGNAIGDYAIWRCKFNTHFYAPGRTGVT